MKKILIVLSFISLYLIGCNKVTVDLENEVKEEYLYLVENDNNYQYIDLAGETYYTFAKNELNDKTNRTINKNKGFISLKSGNYFTDNSKTLTKTTEHYTPIRAKNNLDIYMYRKDNEYFDLTFSKINNLDNYQVITTIVDNVLLAYSENDNKSMFITPDGKQYGNIEGYVIKPVIGVPIPSIGIIEADDGKYFYQSRDENMIKLFDENFGLVGVLNNNSFYLLENNAQERDGSYYFIANSMNPHTYKLENMLIFESDIPSDLPDIIGLDKETKYINTLSVNTYYLFSLNGFIYGLDYKKSISTNEYEYQISKYDKNINRIDTYISRVKYSSNRENYELNYDPYTKKVEYVEKGQYIINGIKYNGVVERFLVNETLYLYVPGENTLYEYNDEMLHIYNNVLYCNTTDNNVYYMSKLTDLYFITNNSLYLVYTSKKEFEFDIDLVNVDKVYGIHNEVFIASNGDTLYINLENNLTEVYKGTLTLTNLDKWYM